MLYVHNYIYNMQLQANKEPIITYLLIEILTYLYYHSYNNSTLFLSNSQMLCQYNTITL